MFYRFTLIFNPYDFDLVFTYPLSVYAWDLYGAVMEMQDFISSCYLDCVVSYDYTVIDSDGMEQRGTFSTDFYNKYLRG